jgi:RecB family exonuclease
MAHTAFSYSRLNNFEKCPRQFYEINIRKAVKEDETPAMKDGKDAHKALELRVKQGKKLPVNLSHHEGTIAKIIASPAVKQTEMQLAITPAFEPCDWFDPRGGPPTVWCRAIVDLGLLNGEGAVIIDYKTGKMSDDFTQLRLTGAVYFQHFPEVQRLSLAFLWLKHGKVTREPMSRDEIPEVWDGLMPRINRYQEAFRKQEFPPRPDRHCKWCVVKSCPYFEGKT